MSPYNLASVVWYNHKPLVYIRIKAQGILTKYLATRIGIEPMQLRLKV